MDFQELINKAKHIKTKYRVLNRLEGGRHWGADEYLKGFMGDVGDLSKLIMAKQGYQFADIDVDSKLEHELADCLYAIIAISDELDIDLENAFLKTMKHLETKIAEKSIKPMRKKI